MKHLRLFESFREDYFNMFHYFAYINNSIYKI